jgi:hypothetical protein
MRNMNYGYECRGWNMSQKIELAGRLEGLLHEKKYDLPDYRHPYIEIDQLYQGVRIRKITDLTERQHSELVKGADKIYGELCPEDEKEIRQLGYDVPAKVHPDTSRELNERL